MGQRQRLRLAMAFLHEPRLALLDEPATSLDDAGLELLAGVVSGFVANGGTVLWCAPAAADIRHPVDVAFTLTERAGADVMSTAIAYVDAALAVAKRDMVVFRTYRLRFPAQVLRSFLAVALFYYISRLVTAAPFDRPEAYFAFAVIGLAIMEVMFSTLSALPGRVRHEIVAGTFERFVVSPFGAVAAVVSMTVFPLLLALLSGVLTVGFAATVFGMPVRVGDGPARHPDRPDRLPLVRRVRARRCRVGDPLQGGAGRGRVPHDGDLLSRWLRLPCRATPRLDPVDVGRAAVHADGGAAAQRARRHTPRRLPMARGGQDRSRGRSCCCRCRRWPLCSRSGRAGSVGRSSSTEGMTRDDATGSMLDRSFRLPSHVVFRAFALETVVVNLERGVYHGLNPTAGRMLETLARASSVRAAAAALAEELGQPQAVVEADLAALCADLLARGLIETAR